MKTPEEVKKRLITSATFCDHCGYNGEPNGCNHPGGLCQAWVSADDAFELIKQLEAQVPKWISVEERLPDDLEEVLILVKETEFYGQYKEFSKSYFCQYIGCVDDGEWFTVWCHGHRYIKDTAKEPCADKLEVTHWMPLPEPPKEG